jgi:aminomethyltransferase
MPVGTAVHPRVLALSESLNFREWSGYYAASAYGSHHEREYHAIRAASALIDVSPLFKYLVSGPDAVRLVDRIITRDATTLEVGQVFYTPWCDERGKVIDDGTVTRVEEDVFRWTAADPSLRWLTMNAAGLQVEIRDVSARVAALALQGPTSAGILNGLGVIGVRELGYFRMTRASIAGVPVDISRTGYTGDLGYEIWIPWDRAIDVWDALMDEGRRFGIRPTGMLALDVARVEAGLLLIDVDFHGSRKVTVDSQRYSPFEMGLGRLVQLDKAPYIGRDALAAEQRRPRARRIVGLEADWTAVERLYDRLGMAPQLPSTASRVAVPVYHRAQQIGRATTTAWSPTLKKLIALATIKSPHDAVDTAVELEVTVDAVRHRVPATIVKTPFFNPARKRAVPAPVAEA